jgi:hypothetical protein
MRWSRPRPRRQRRPPNRSRRGFIRHPISRRRLRSGRRPINRLSRLPNHPSRFTASRPNNSPIFNSPLISRRSRHSMRSRHRRLNTLLLSSTRSRRSTPRNLLSTLRSPRSMPRRSTLHRSSNSLRNTRRSRPSTHRRSQSTRPNRRSRHSMRSRHRRLNTHLNRRHRLPRQSQLPPQLLSLNPLLSRLRFHVPPRHRNRDSLKSWAPCRLRFSCCFLRWSFSY